MPLSAYTALEQANTDSSRVPWRWGSKDILDDLGKRGLTNAECAVINRIRAIYEAATNQAGSLVFHGAHVRLNDKGAFYDWLLKKFYETDLKGGVRENKAQLGSDLGLALTSSHYKNKATGKVHGAQYVQMEIRFPGSAGCLLFGGTDKFSWFQTEAYAGTGSSGGEGWNPSNLWSGAVGIGTFMKDAALHGSTFVQYKVTGYNVGPYGYSSYTEAAPLVA